MMSNCGCVSKAVVIEVVHAAPLHIKGPCGDVGPQLGLSREERLTLCFTILLHGGPNAQPYSWGGKAMPLGKLTPEVAHNHSNNPIDSSLRNHQPETDSSGFYNDSLLGTWGKMSPEVLWSAEETAGSQKLLSKKRVDFLLSVYNVWAIDAALVSFDRQLFLDVSK